MAKRLFNGFDKKLKAVFHVDKLILDPSIEDELWEIWCYIARDNPEAATRVVEAAFQTFAMVVSNPHVGRVRKFHNPRLRGIRSRLVVGFRNYIIFYRQESDCIRILHVYHGAQDLEALFDPSER